MAQSRLREAQGQGTRVNRWQERCPNGLQNTVRRGTWRQQQWHLQWHQWGGKVEKTCGYLCHGSGFGKGYKALPVPIPGTPVPATCTGLANPWSSLLVKVQSVSVVILSGMHASPSSESFTCSYGVALPTHRTSLLVVVTPSGLPLNCVLLELTTCTEASQCTQRSALEK
jgi:hypothetical protein